MFKHEMAVVFLQEEGVEFKAPIQVPLTVLKKAGIRVGSTIDLSTYEILNREVIEFVRILQQLEVDKIKFN